MAAVAPDPQTPAVRACLSDDTVVAWLDGALDAEAQAEARAHIARCDACRRLVGHSAEAADAEHDSDPALVATVRAGDAERAPSLLPGEMIGRYEVLSVLGAGAMGVVYAGRDSELGREVALKVARTGSEGEQLRARLLREARAASAVRHPGVVTVHEVMTLPDGTPVIVMERLAGCSLREHLEAHGTMSAAEATALAVALLDALAAAHAIGVVHRDLKPDNIFIAPDGQPTIVDFGIAKITRVDEVTAQTMGLTATGVLAGTPHYMAPEQAFAMDEVDARTDLWAVGAVLYECVSGSRPIDGKHLGEILRRLALLDVTPLVEVCSVPEGFARAVTALLSERAERPESAAAAKALFTAPPESVPISRRRPRVWLAVSAALAAVGIVYGVLVIVEPEPVALATWPNTAPAVLPDSAVDAAAPSAQSIAPLAQLRDAEPDGEPAPPKEAVPATPRADLPVPPAAVAPAQPFPAQPLPAEPPPVEPPQPASDEPAKGPGNLLAEPPF